MIDRALALNLAAIAKREAANGNEHIAKVLTLTADAIKDGADVLDQISKLCDQCSDPRGWLATNVRDAVARARAIPANPESN